MALLPQLDAGRSKTCTVQTKSDARFIAERSYRNAISYMMAVAVAHYQVGAPDPRFKSIDKASEGAQLLYKLLKKENDGKDMKVVLPMFISTTDDATMFTFEGAVSGKSEFIIKKGQNGTRSAFTNKASSVNTDSHRGIRIWHSVTFNVVGNQAPLYATVYDLSEEELPSAMCPSGVFTIPIPGLCYGGNQDCSNETFGYFVFFRSTKKEDMISADQLNHKQYRNNIFLPYIAKCREYYLRSEEWKQGDPVDDNNLWTNWQVSAQTNTPLAIFHSPPIHLTPITFPTPTLERILHQPHPPPD